MDKIFDHFKKIFNERGYRFYMIGGASRDYILGLKIKDYDFVTDATPDQTKTFLKGDYHFGKYGVIKSSYDGINVDIATLRKEKDYLDNRHPSKIEFVKSILEDYKRRDFTINSIYIDEEYNIIDPSNCGVNDLKNKELVFLGDPLIRIKEDPLRILRAKRFIVQYDLKIKKELKTIFHDNLYLLEELNKDKINEENKKFVKISGGKNYEF